MVSRAGVSDDNCHHASAPMPASALRCVASGGGGMTLGLGACPMKGIWFNSLHLLGKEHNHWKGEVLKYFKLVLLPFVYSFCKAWADAQIQAPFSFQLCCS